MAVEVRIGTAQSIRSKIDGAKAKLAAVREKIGKGYALQFTIRQDARTPYQGQSSAPTNTQVLTWLHHGTKPHMVTRGERTWRHPGQPPRPVLSWTQLCATVARSAARAYCDPYWTARPPQVPNTMGMLLSAAVAVRDLIALRIMHSGGDVQLPRNAPSWLARKARLGLLPGPAIASGQLFRAVSTATPTVRKTG